MEFCHFVFLALQVPFRLVYLTFVHSAPEPLKELFPPLDSIFKPFEGKGRLGNLLVLAFFPKVLGGG